VRAGHCWQRAERAERRQNCAGESERTATTQPGPHSVAGLADERLDDDAGNRRGEPQERELVGISAKAAINRTMLAICRLQPNWLPRKPKLMFQTCQKFRRDFRMAQLALKATDWECYYFSATEFAAR
jgi:hypothetical protein